MKLTIYILVSKRTHNIFDIPEKVGFGSYYLHVFESALKVLVYLAVPIFGIFKDYA